jgi:alpha-L-fucosidase 2
MTTGEEKDFRWEWSAAKSATTERPPPEYQPNPPGVLGEEKGVLTCEQPLLVGGAYATAWKQEPATGDRRKTFISVAISPRPGVARRDALDSLNRAATGNLDAFVAGHRAWWHAYYPQSFISLPSGRVENYYWLAVYRFASATRATGGVLDTQGPWFRNTLELGMSLTRWLDRNLGNFISNTPWIRRCSSASIRCCGARSTTTATS